jgi:hypothetical protein
MQPLLKQYGKRFPRTWPESTESWPSHPARVDAVSLLRRETTSGSGWADPARELIERDRKPRMYGTITITEAVKKLVAAMTAVQSRQ